MMTMLPELAYLISVNGEISEIVPLNGKTFSLEEVQKYVEGYIEIVYLNDMQIMIVNEEGKFYKKYNLFATEIAYLNSALGTGDYICGNTVICPSRMLP